ncbi:hypothetical protein HN51_027594, partial [Arachis hypogaea]
MKDVSINLARSLCKWTRCSHNQHYENAKGAYSKFKILIEHFYGKGTLLAISHYLVKSRTVAIWLQGVVNWTILTFLIKKCSRGPVAIRYLQ